MKFTTNTDLTSLTGTKIPKNTFVDVEIFKSDGDEWVRVIRPDGVVLRVKAKYLSPMAGLFYCQ